jgi:hypothetical protein
MDNGGSMPVEPSRPPRGDETPLCTIVISNFRSTRRNDETPRYTYVQGAKDAQWLRIEPSRRRRGDETPTYVRASEMPISAEQRIRFGDWLVRRGLITRAQLYRALEIARSRACRIGDALVEMELINRLGIEEEASAHSAFAALQSGAPLTAP